MRNLKFTAILAAAIALSAVNVQAEDNAPACISPERWLADMAAGVDSRLTVETLADLDGENGKIAVARLNASPPPTDIVADRMIILRGTLKATGQQIPNVLFAVFNKGCLVAYHEMPGAHLLTIISREAGEGA